MWGTFKGKEKSHASGKTAAGRFLSKHGRQGRFHPYPRLLENSRSAAPGTMAVPAGPGGRKQLRNYTLLSGSKEGGRTQEAGSTLRSFPPPASCLLLPASCFLPPAYWLVLFVAAAARLTSLSTPCERLSRMACRMRSLSRSVHISRMVFQPSSPLPPYR